jgi:capsular polysaccharide transport system ATP-binding protein
MSIELHDVSKAVLAGRSRRSVFKHLDFWMEATDRVAVLGVRGSGTDTFLEIVCGEAVDEGWVECTSRISWAIPSSTFLASMSSVATNLRFVARLYGLADKEKFVEEVIQMAQIEAYTNEKLNTCPRTVRMQMSFAMGLWFDFDIYLFSEKVLPASKPFLRRATEILKARTQGKGMLVATSSPAVAQQYCDTAFVIDQGRADYYTDMKMALRHFKSLARNAVVLETEAPEEEDEEIGSELDLL